MNIFYFLVSFLAVLISHGQTQYPAYDFNVSERYPTNETSTPINLPSLSPTGDVITGHEIITPPTKGALSGSIGTSYTYTPAYYNEASDEFVWRAYEDNGTDFVPVDYKVIINVIPVNNPPVFSTNVQNAYDVDENQNQVATISVIDYDSDATAGNLNLSVVSDPLSSHDNLFGISPTVTKAGDTYNFSLIFKNGITVNYENPPLGVLTYTFDLNVTDDGGSWAGHSPVSVTIQPVNEPPEITSALSFQRTITEGDNTETKQDFQPIQIRANDPEGGQVFWQFQRSNSNIGGTVKLESTVLTEGVMSPISFASNTYINFHYEPDEHDYTPTGGPQEITLTAYDASNNPASQDIVIEFTIDRVDDDPISLNEASPITISWEENKVGVLHDFDPTDYDSTANENNLVDNNTSSVEGAKIYYDISGEDEEFFTISSTGELTFISTPDFENPVDQTGGSQNQLEGNNQYDITVTVRDRSDASSNLTNTDSQNVTINVTDVNELPTLVSGTYSYPITVTEDDVWTWSSALFPLTATDVDDGHSSTLEWRIKYTQPGLFGTPSISGTGANPTSFTYTPQSDYYGTGGNDFFVVQVEDEDGGVVELDFNVSFVGSEDGPRVNLITPAPVEVVSSTRDFYTIYLNENSPSTVRIDFFEPDGQGLDSIVFEQGDSILDHQLFTELNSTNANVSLAQQYAEITFKPQFLPDFEVPGDANGDGNYSVQLTVKDNGPAQAQLSVRLDFIIQDVDDKPSFSSLTNFSPEAAENQLDIITLTGNDQDGVTQFFWSITGGDTDIFEFEYDSTTAVASNKLLFKTEPDYESLKDRNYTYSVQVGLNDGSSQEYGTFSVRVTDDNDAPVITVPSINIDEPLKYSDKIPASFSLYAMELSQYVTDDDNLSGLGPDTITWQEVGGETEDFVLDQNGSLRFNLPTDFETKTSHYVVVRASDGRGGFDDFNLTIGVNEMSEPPEFFADPNSTVKIDYLEFSLNEDTSVSGDISFYTRDPDTGSNSGVTYFTSYDDSNGTFDFNGDGGTTGKFTFTPDTNYVGTTVVNVSATDGSFSSQIPLIFTVLALSDPPIVREGNNSSELATQIMTVVQENNSTWSMELNASDPYDIPSSTVFLWSLSGPDAPLFKVFPDTGYLTSLTLRNPPDYENPNDDDNDSIYDLNVTVTDVDATSFTFNLTLVVQNEDEPPFFEYSDDNATPVVQKIAGPYPEYTGGVWSGGPSLDVGKNQYVVFDVSATDYEGNTITYGFTDHNPSNNSGSLGPANNHYNDNDPSIFAIDSQSGRITFIDESLIDHEDGLGTVSTSKNTYVLEVNATDDSNNPDQVRHLIYLTIENVVEEPDFRDDSNVSITSWARTVSENQITDSNFTLSSFSEDSNFTIEYFLAGGNDLTKFNLNSATGVLEFVDAQDYELPTDSNADGIYQVQVGINGTSALLDLNFSLRDANDAPEITNTGLTQIVIPENTGYVLDVDVSDQDSGKEYPDLIFINGPTSTVDFISHTGVVSSVSDFYNGSSSATIETFAGPSYVASADFNNDGYQDLVVLNQGTNSIEYSVFDDATGLFDTPTQLTGTVNGPNFCVVSDLDEDGYKDLIVSFVDVDKDVIGWFRNNSGTFAVMQTLIGSDTASGVFNEFDHFAMGDVDGDSYVDIVVARKRYNAVDIFVNDGSNSFSLNKSITSLDGSTPLDAPSTVDLADFDSSGTADILISAKYNLVLGYSGGLAADGNLSIVMETLESHGKDGLFAKAFDLNRDDSLDVVFGIQDPTSAPVPKVMIQGANGFNSSITLPIDANGGFSRPTDVRLIPATDSTRETLVVSDDVSQYLALYEAKASNDGTFNLPVLVDTGVTNKLIVLSDINRSEDYFTYEFAGGEDKDKFNEFRFSNDGRLYFEAPFPNFENPTDNGASNRYDVIVKVEDQHGDSTQEMISVTISDINDKPVITSLDGNWTSSFDHNESNTSLYLFTITATNEESPTESVSFGKSGGADQQYFDVDAVTGEVSFFVQPDYESPLDSDENNSYNIILRATDGGGAFDEQNVTVHILDTYEPPVFGKPIISNQGLTTLELDENIGFVVDLDVIDPNATAENLDIVFVSSLTNEIRSVDHTENNSSVAVMYPGSGTSLIEPFTEPTQVVAGDFNKDGFDDLFVLDKDPLNPSQKKIHYLEWDDNTQSFVTPSVELVLGADTNPSHLVVKDLDQDGDLDLVVSFNETSSDKIGWFENDQGGAGLGNFSSNTILITNQTSETISHFAVGDLDGDSFDDLVVTRLNGVADIYLNDKGANPTFTWRQTELGTFDKPRYVELGDFDNSGTLDLLISAKNEVLVGYNHGMGTNNKISFSYTSIGTYSGEGRFAKAYDLTDDGALDVVYAAQINAPPSVVVQSNGSFLPPIPLNLHQNAGVALNYPSDLKIIPQKGQNLTTLVFSDDSNPYLSLYEATPQQNGTFEDPVALDIGSSTKSFVLSDLGRESQIFQYSFVGGEDRALFDENRFKDGGKLYFSTLPDYEYPNDLGEFNRYDVMVKVEDGNGESTIQSVVVLVNDKNDAPYITSLDGNWTSSFNHLETNTTLDLFTVEASNTETDVGDEKLSYSILPQEDHTFFEINSTTGLVSLLSTLDYENPSDANQDNNYSIIIRVTDDGVDPQYDEQNVTIVIQDGPEAPSFGYNVTSYVIIEDSTLSNIDLNVTDDNANPAPGPGIDTLTSMGEQNGDVTFNNSSTPPTFTYTPDANFSGLESFTIIATNHQGLTDSIDLNVTVTSVNDLPEITTARIIDVGEGTQRISSLHANDDSAGEVVWSWANANSADPDFSLSSTGLLQFNNHGGADYENLTDQVEDFLPTDAFKLVLWLDADDNETLYKTFNFNDYAESNESGTSVGGWKDKSTQGTDVFIDHTGSGYRPKIGFINGRTALDFQGDVQVQELRAQSRLGLVPNPDLLVFTVTHVDSSVNDSDKILRIGDNGVGSVDHPLTVVAGSGGWSWRFNGGQTYYDGAPSPDNTLGIQVWERSSGERFSSSKFYLNGVEFAARQGGSDDFPDSNADYLEVGNGFDGRIGEIIVLNSTASDDREKLEGYLAHKWGLTDKLSTAHPYRYNRPTHIKWERSIRVTDSDGNFTDSNFTIRVANQNDNLPVINNPEIQNTSRIHHYEYSDLNNVNYPVIDFNVTDIDGDIVEFNVVGGNDALLFDFNNSSKLSFKSWISNDHPDFENPKDYDLDNVYEVEIEITDGNASHTITKLLKIEIINGNEDPPEFTYDGAVVTSLDLNQTENNKTVIQLTTIDDWTGPIDYSITGGTDGSLFEVNATTGLLSFYQAPNFEFPHNNPASNDYQVEVTASDENNYSTSILIEVNVTDINEPPGFGGGFTMPVEVDEDSSTTFVMEIYDPEDPNQTLFPFEFPPKVLPSHGTFTEAGQGQYTYTPDPNYNGDDMIVITVNDANLQKDFNVTFQINPVGDNPTAEDDEFVVELNMGDPIALDVLYNDSNLPDANNTVGLSIDSDSLTQPGGGSVEVVNGNVIHYTPNAQFIGTDSFTYRMRNDANLTATASVKVFVQQAEGLKNWRFLSNFGFYMISGNNWIYHGDLGWVFAQDLSKLNSVSWMWHEKIGWFWTGNEYVPDLYVNDFSSWFRFSSSVSNGIYLTWPIYDQEEQEWLSMENYFNKQQNLVKGHIRQALEGLQSNDEIIEYIEAHSFFTKEQIATIKYELKFKGISKTLSSLLEE